MKKYIYISLLLILCFSCSTDDITSETTSESEITTENSIAENMDENIFPGDVVLSSQEAVDSFGEFNFTTIIGSLVIGDDRLNSGEFNNITDLSSLTSITRVFGNITIGYTSLISVSGLDNIASCDGFLINRNNNLESLDNLSSQITFVSDLTINRNPNLSSLPNFENLDEIKQVRILTNASLENLNGLNSITSIGRCEIIANTSLLNIDGLQNVTTITDGLFIFDNTILNNIQGLLSLTTIETDLTVTDGTNGGNMQISFNPELTSLEGLSNLIEVGTYRIDANASLSDFCALQNLFTNGEVFFPNTSTIGGNAFNPTVEDIQNGNCSM